MKTLPEVISVILTAIENGTLGMDKLTACICKRESTDADAYVAYVAMITYLGEKKPDHYEAAIKALNDIMITIHPCVMDTGGSKPPSGEAR